MDELDITSDIHALAYTEGFVIAADYTDGIVTLSTDPLDFHTILTSGSRGYDVVIDNNYIYGGLGSGGFSVWDLHAATSLEGTLPFKFLPFLAVLPIVFVKKLKKIDR